MSNTKPSLLVVGKDPAEIQALLPFAHKLAPARGLQKTVMGLIELPPAESLSGGARAAQQLRQSLNAQICPETQLLVRVTHDLIREVTAFIKAEQVELLLMNAASASAAALMRSVPCDVVIVKGTFDESLSHILLPIRGGPYAALALQIALAFADECRADITLLHATPPKILRKNRMRELFKHVRSLPQVKRWERVEGDATKSILAFAKRNKHQLLVMGAMANPPPDGAPVGPTAMRILEQTKIPALIVKTAKGFTPGTPADFSVPPVDYTISVVVDKWFAENTFHAHEFEDIGQLVALKEKQGLTISLGLPTLNEEQTIGGVIKTMRKRFVHDYPLLDEIVVIDSNSTDRTVTIAEGLGVPVVKHPEVLPQYGTWAGKGEALWDSLYVLSGDLITWIDTDIVNIHPRFVYGILGPLIREPHLMYVKGFYQRPLRLGKKLEARGGGRVTELCARPLLNLFYPELSGFVQPLAGEYAGRRAALEQVPFFTGYGVETGLLIDLWARFGLSAMGQVDLEERVHRNQSLHALSKMAFEITQVVMQRVGETRGIELVEQINRSMKLIRYENDDFDLEVADIQIRQRPPMLSIPEYRAARGLEPLAAQEQARAA